jgi:inhibitor of cysteine peptidase
VLFRNYCDIPIKGVIVKNHTLQQLAVTLGVLLIFVGFNSAGVSCNIRSNEIVGEIAGMSEIVITPSDQGKIFEANQGELIVIRLEENPTTGYQWEMGAVDSQIIEILDSDYSPTSGTGVGGGGTHTFRFRAKSPGRGKIQLRLRRSWEPVDAAIERFEVNILVQ